MPINFFELGCADSSNALQFGLCDDSLQETARAYIHNNHPASWIGIVNNPKEEEVSFFAIDNCVSILKEDGSSESRCDGMLSYANNLIFVELKSRETGRWVKKGREQLTATIRKFSQNHNLGDYTKVEAYVCNNLRPIAHAGQATNIQRFKNDTGLILRCQREINL